MSKIQVNEIVNHFDNGAPDCPKGFTVSSGISTFTGAIDANGSLDVDGHTNLDNVNISGVVTAASLDVTGNVSVGGTLTYEDVTSIDSVGIITAQSGIHVTGGVQVGTGATITGSTNIITASTNGSERVRIASTGRVAIGNATNNASPTALLGVIADDGEAADLYVGKFHNLEATAGQSYGVDIRAGSNSTDHGFRVKNRANDATQFLVRGDGNVGINESSPGGLLQVGASSGSHVIITPNIGLDINDGALNLYQATSNVNATPFIISTDVGGTETEKLRFTGGGKLGIGTDDPQEKLHVSGGNIKLDDGYGIDFSHVVSPNPGASASNSLLDDYEEGTWDAVLRYHTSVGDTSGTGNNGISASEARYTKIGNLVYITCSFTTASTAYYVYQEIRNLPFTPQRAGVLNLYVRGGRYRYAGGASADAFFYGGIYASDLTINTGSERTDTTSSGWVEVISSSQLFRVCGSYLTS